MKQHFENATAQIRAADSVPSLLTAAFAALEVVERATSVLAETAPADTYPGYQLARAEATNAWAALSTAPTLNYRDRPDAGGVDVREFAASIADFVLVVAEAIVNVASKTTQPDDQVACLRATRHAGHIHTALR